MDKKQEESELESESEPKESRWRLLQNYAHRILPWLIDSSYMKQSLRWHYKLDPKENEKTRPAESEQINLHCLWAAEFYTPLHAEDLASAFVNLEWDKDVFGAGRNPVIWLERSRTRPYGGGWSSLGILVPPDSKRLWVGTTRKINLPEHVEYATAHLYNLSSSITCLVIGFVFDEEYGLIYDRALRQEYKTYINPLKRGWSIMTPDFQKRDRIIQLRHEIRKKAKDWFTKNIPGVFCNTDEHNKHFPTCEFVTLKGLEPFPDSGNGDSRHAWLLHILEMDDDWNWKSDKISGLKFSWPVMRGDEKSFHATLAISNENLRKVDMKLYGGYNQSGYIALLGGKVSELVSRWACLSLISAHEERLFRIRDSKNYKASNKKTLNFLKSTRDLVSESLDISTLCPELIKFSQEGLHFHYDGDTFRASKTYGSQKEPMSFVEALSSEVEQGSKRLLELDRSLKELIIQQGNLLSASENIKLQKSIWVLTFIIAVLTVVMVYDSLKDINFLDIWILIKVKLRALVK